NRARRTLRSGEPSRSSGRGPHAGPRHRGRRVRCGARAEGLKRLRHGPGLAPGHGIGPLGRSFWRDGSVLSGIIGSGVTDGTPPGGVMKGYTLLALVLFLGFLDQADAQEGKATPYPAMAPIAQYRIADPQDEIALARSAAPPSISADAEVLVLGNQGYETAVKGKNGFVCFVERSWAAGFDDPEFWNPKLRAPNCFNPPAARTELPQYLKRTEWVLAGATRQQIIDRTRAAVASHDFKAPEAGALSFMLSKNGYLSDDAAGPWLPHVMFFLLHGQANDGGANKEGSPIVGQDGSAIETTILVVPVRSWSDGSPAPPPPEKHLIAGEDQGRIKAALEERYKEWLAAENRRDAETLTSF